MKFAEFLAKRARRRSSCDTWTFLRYSKKGNRVLQGHLIDGYDTLGSGGGYAWSQDVEVVVNPKTDEVVSYVVFATDDYPY